MRGADRANRVPEDGFDSEGWIEIPLPVGTAHDGYRVDRFIAAVIPRLSRTRIQRIIERGQVWLRGRVVERSAQRVRAGQRLTVWRPAPPEPPAVLDYTELFVDEHVLVVDKPAGLPVHPSARYHRHTLTAVMRERLGAGHGWEMAHRLDRETSGVVIFGRHRASASVLKRSFARREVRKEYLAIVHGRLDEPRSIDLPLGAAVDSAIKVKMGPRPVEDGGAAAHTAVEPIAAGVFRQRPITLVRARPTTGRQHQIRAHLAAIGHGVVGDKMYGIDERWFLDVVECGRPLAELDEHLGLCRHALHALRLELPHPATGQRVAFTAPWPAELAELIALPDAPG